LKKSTYRLQQGDIPLDCCIRTSGNELDLLGLLLHGSKPLEELLIKKQVNK
jgi:hypothetical protein